MPTCMRGPPRPAAACPAPTPVPPVPQMPQGAMPMHMPMHMFPPGMAMGPGMAMPGFPAGGTALPMPMGELRDPPPPPHTHLRPCLQHLHGHSLQRLHACMHAAPTGLRLADHCAGGGGRGAQE